jgi:hypothetical protein
MKRFEILLGLFQLYKLFGDREYTIKKLSDELHLNPKSGLVYRRKIFQEFIEKGILVETKKERWSYYKINKKKLIEEILKHPFTKIIIQVIDEY